MVIVYVLLYQMVEDRLKMYVVVTNKYYILTYATIIMWICGSLFIRIFIGLVIYAREGKKRYWTISGNALISFIILLLFGMMMTITQGINTILNQPYIVATTAALFMIPRKK